MARRPLRRSTGTAGRGEKKNGELSYRSDWKGSRRWIGPDWWANPLTDWNLRDGAAVAAAAANRTLCLLPADLGAGGDRFDVSVVIEALGGPRGALGGPRGAKAAAGFRIGRRGGIDDYRHALVHATVSIDATIETTGKLTLGDEVSRETMSLADGPVTLRLQGRRDDGDMQLTLTATRDDKSVSVESRVPSAAITGGVALLSDGPNMPGGTAAKQRFSFRDFILQGDVAVQHEDRNFGPILWSQYTLSDSRLRLQAQLAPLGKNPKHEAELWVADDEGRPQWTKVAATPMEKVSRTVTFTVDGWDARVAKRYQVRFGWRNREYVWEGRIRREPTVDEPLKLGCFSCDNGYLFPIPAMVKQVSRQNPDMLFFAGDQIYESYGGFGVARGAETETAMLDYLRKYYQFGWTWRELMRDRPTVILPDDHDVFQGNLWGHGGRKLPAAEQGYDWTLGGYLMPGDWVAAIERTQVGHLPDPAVDMSLPIGIKSYFTDMVYGGVGFAVLEDRKFKTGPKSMPEAERAEGQGAELLGPQQEAFLRDWAEDWRRHRMKCALSQTIFCRAATHTGQNLKRSRGIFDSGGWPKAARNRVVRILGDCNAISIHGDQHLGTLLRQGVEDFDDAGYAFMVPGTANGFPRAWWPGHGNQPPPPGQDYTGKFRDDCGHPIHVLAVGNPEPGSNRLPKTADPMELGYRKGSGYGIVEFDKNAKTATVSLYRLGDRGEMFEGFPQTLDVGGNPGQGASPGQ